MSERSRPGETRILLIKDSQRATISSIRTQVFLDHDQAPIPQRSVAPLKKCDEILIAEMTQAPLAPDDIVAHINLVRGPRRLVAHAIEECRAMGVERIEGLERALEDGDALGLIGDACPRVFSAGKGVIGIGTG